MYVAIKIYSVTYKKPNNKILNYVVLRTKMEIPGK